MGPGVLTQMAASNPYLVVGGIKQGGRRTRRRRTGGLLKSLRHTAKTLKSHLDTTRGNLSRAVTGKHKASKDCWVPRGDDYNWNPRCEEDKKGAFPKPKTEREKHAEINATRRSERATAMAKYLKISHTSK
ncbi:MAG: hypothetical protein EBS86_08060 [Crocinitomicaceae bacterium]|nr:hypothetical protein [Crocinitomicaceae bacterium]